MTYVLKYKKSGSWFWKKAVVIGHRYDKESNHMDLYSTNGSITSIASWSEHDLFLGKDWVEMTKAQMEEQAGTTIPLKAGIGK